MKPTLPLLVVLSLLHANSHSEGALPTAQEIIAVVEVGGAQCVKLNFTTADTQVALRQYLASLLKKRTYDEYMTTGAYEVAKSKALEDIQKNGIDKRLCGWLSRLPSTPPGELMFVEPGR